MIAGASRRKRALRGAALLFACGAALTCSHQIKTRFPTPEPVPLEQPMLVALLAPVDLRLAKGGARTHVEIRDPAERDDRPYTSRPYPRDPSDDYGWTPFPQRAQTDNVRIKPTGQFATREVLEPLQDAFAQRLTALLGEGRVRDASEDPLAAEPDSSRAAAFLAAYPAYEAAAWLEVIDARADLPDWSALQSLMTVASVCSVGLLAWVFLIPVSLDSDVDVIVRAYLLLRTQDRPLAVAVSIQREIDASGSVAFDVDRFRADLAELLASDAGTRLADEMATKVRSTR